jgi:hypothetical protein
MSSDDVVLSMKEAIGAGFTSLCLIPVEIIMALAFPFELAEKFSDDTVLFVKGASGAASTLLDLILVEINIRSDPSQNGYKKIS